MDFLEEFALIGAIGVPIALVALGNIYLALTGERGTLLMPSASRLGAFLAEPEEEAGAETPGPDEA